MPIPMQIGNWMQRQAEDGNPFIKMELNSANANYGQLKASELLHIICISSNLALIRYGMLVDMTIDDTDLSGMGTQFHCQKRSML